MLRSRSVLSGMFAEQLAPYLPNFPFSPTEAKSIGAPIDFLVFKGMDAQSIEEVIFVEVKSGSAGPNQNERSPKTRSTTNASAGRSTASQPRHSLRHCHRIRALIHGRPAEENLGAWY